MPNAKRSLKLHLKYKVDTGRSLKRFGHTETSYFEMIHYCYVHYRPRRCLLCYLNARFVIGAVVLLSESKDIACAARVLTTVNMFPAKGKVFLVLD